MKGSFVFLQSPNTSTVSVAWLRYLLLLILARFLFGQKPDTLCRTDHRYVDDHIYPDDWHLIVDSYDYEDLFGGSRAVWKQRDVDGDTKGWNDAFGGTCQLEIGVGSCSRSSNQDNWFFTGYNSYGNAIEVILSVTFRWSGCSQSSNCDNVAVYRNDTNSTTVTESSQIDPANYLPTPLTEDLMTSRLHHTGSGDTTVEIVFNRPEDFNGLYLGFRDTGACGGQIKRFQSYYRITPQVVEGLLSCPEVPLARGRTTSSSCVCAENSNTTGNLERMCTSDGECSELPECTCNEGYSISSNGSTCIGCSAGTYRSSTQSQTRCIACPRNTDTSQKAATKCACIDGFFRADNEGASDGCSRPPTAVRNLRVSDVTQTTITLRWEKPSITSRDDFYYEILRSDETTVSNYNHLMTLPGGTKTTVEYRDTGLTPSTTYVYRVVAHNNVSDQDSINQHLRTREVTETTLDGAPSKPIRVRGFCSVVVWGEPVEPKGSIIGYDINFYDMDNPSTNRVVYGVTNTVHDVIENTDLPNGVEPDTLNFEVRANTSTSRGGGAGSWSDGISLGCSDSCDPPNPPECPSEPVPLHFSLDGVSYPHNSIFFITDIGEDDSALLCVTNNTDCCGNPRHGEWVYPNGTLIPSSRENWDFFRGRGDRTVRLSRRNNAMSPTGTYQCRVPDASGATQTIQARIIGPSPPATTMPTTPPTCPPPPTPDCPPTVTCSSPVTPEPPICPPPAPIEVHFTLKGVKYPNNSIFDASLIGQLGDSSLRCVTNRTGCCTSPNRGNWLFSNGTTVQGNENIFFARGNQFLSLSRRNNAMFPTGTYQCRVPDASNVVQTIQATIIDTAPCPPPPACPTPSSPTPCTPTDPVECPSTISPPGAVEVLHFSLGGVDYPNNSIFFISDIEQSASALLCVTNNTACCGNPRHGEWVYPNGTLIPSSRENWDFFRGRGDRTVRLSRRNNAMSPTGTYQCRVPDASGATQTIQARIINSDSPTDTSTPCPTQESTENTTCAPCPTQEPTEGSCPPTTDVRPGELISVATMINDVVILTSIGGLEGVIAEITVKFTLINEPQVYETITEELKPWVRVPNDILQNRQDSPISVQVRPEYMNGTSGTFSSPTTFTSSESEALFEAVTSGGCEPCDTIKYRIIMAALGLALLITFICIFVAIIVLIIKCKKRKKTSSLSYSYGTNKQDLELYNPTYNHTSK